MMLQHSVLAEALRLNTTIDFEAASPRVGASNDNARIARFFARLLHALHESRRMQAEREIARHRHLIPPWTPAGTSFDVGPRRGRPGC
jgi:hypothetical protein